ncbi:MAG: transcription antitermination factor NusB [Clostridia bacterium]|nr:transcription antitermination factor NusB [Clostridia bacterium]
MTRHEAREVAFIITFEKSFLKDSSISEVIESAEESEFFEVNNYVIRTTKGVFENLEAIDKTIEENLVGWSAKRISRVAAAIMRVAVFELLFGGEEVPVGVAINEAVEIAKKYASPEDASYINGVLGAIAKKK